MVLIFHPHPVDPKTRSLSISAVVKKKTNKYLAAVEVTNWFIWYVVIFVAVVSETSSSSGSGSDSGSGSNSDGDGDSEARWRWQ